MGRHEGVLNCFANDYLVAEEGFEPPTQGLWFLCSNHLLNYSSFFYSISTHTITRYPIILYAKRIRKESEKIPKVRPQQKWFKVDSYQVINDSNSQRKKVYRIIETGNQTTSRMNLKTTFHTGTRANSTPYTPYFNYHPIIRQRSSVRGT